jgi:hypothetical protein
MRSVLAWSLVAALLMVFEPTPRLHGYSVLTHESIIDALWDPVLLDLLRTRFPAASAAELGQAHAYAYGGCIIQDMGYYPFGDHFFSDLVHYVRSGDFVLALLRDAQDLNEYAFALGAVAHYAGDTVGHPMVNRAVPMLYPKLGEKYGNVVTYASNTRAHMAVEFGFDVVEAARLVRHDYHDSIGFKVSKPLLDRVFKETYGLDIRDALFNEDLAVATYRYAAGKTIPRVTKVAWQVKQTEIERGTPGITQEAFVYKLSRRSFEREYGKRYRRERLHNRLSPTEYGKGFVTAARKPGVGVRLLAVLYAIVPKFGLLDALTIKPGTPQTEQMLREALAATRREYARLLEEVVAGRLNLANRDFDTGVATQPGEYSLADRAYAKLLAHLEKQHFKNVTPELRANILNFYEYSEASQAVEKHCKACRRIPPELEELRALQSPGTAPSEMEWRFRPGSERFQ